MKPEKLDWDHWRDDLSVGIDAIDTDHKEILALIAKVRRDYQDGGGTPDGLMAAIDAVNRYSERHFSREEAMLAAVGYPYLEVHKARHQGFRDFVAGISAADPVEGTAEIFSYLVDWWVGHIAAEDKQYKDAVKAAPDAAQAALAG
jgi:hemerythrin-like metal-binding protein